ncbi:hypothetical protein GCM10022393_31920 [Aquimarina addita]|uniref:Putative beta-lactamase-inhibitor-like PepSY-like domain-containing protein n=1 Tax=Aquimarina addita TaxID=870485 RepID=A0ABP6URX3_9FLAO
MNYVLSSTLSIFFLTIFACTSFAQEKAPKSVKKSFQSKYPGENDPDWHQDKNGYYEANFKKKGIHYRADFDSSGQWIETESSIKEEDLPEVIRKKIATDFKEYKIVELEEVDHYTKGKFYDVEIKKDGKKQDIEFNAEGTIIN